MPNDNTPDRAKDQLALRVGGTALGLLVGLLVGAVLAVLLIAVEAESVAGWVFFAFTAVGAVAGFLSVSTGLSMAEGVVHFLLGVVGGFNRQLLDPSPLAPRWLHGVLIVGAACGLLFIVWLKW